LDVMERDGLIEHARNVGDYTRARLANLAERHALIGDIRGHGLWIGVELVHDRTSKEPATELTRRVVNQMKARGILMNRIGEFDNVLKMRPPMPFAREQADLVVDTQDEVLAGL
ncbi:MAG: aminotransferase class III-fold pyridoxal phosphate-dependent enzyme, partial [Gammaproteobacteria bacterium]